jgi:hypothetical protein
MRDLYCLTNINYYVNQMYKYERDSARGRDEKCAQNYIVYPERSMPLGRPRRRWVDNIKTDLKE